ncbi:nuclear matrix constituent protein 1-like [Miscanthus floridulus]|uniref:nuclear matrix constituent protein 1-like n=1 Tax=Miscanthus floridulus TaxID=154761 RepID=UPI00345B4396
MDCYNCGDLGHLAHQCPKPKKDKYKKKYKDNKDESSDEEKTRDKPYKKKDGKKKPYHKNKNGKAYIVGDWLTDIESSSGSSGEDSDDEKEKVAALVIATSLPPPPPPPSSSTHLCLMAKGERKVQSDDDSSGSDSDEEFESPSYDELVTLLNKYSKIIIKTRAKNEKLELENDSLLAKYDIAQKASDELRDENKLVSSTLKELKASLKELKEKHDKLEVIHNELNTRYSMLKDEHTTLKINYDTLVIANEFLSNEPHDATNHVVKIDIATSCDDLIDENIEQGSSSKGKQVVVADHYDDYIKIKSENEKLKKDLEKQSTYNTIVIESQDGDMALEMEKLKEENKKLKLEKTHLTTGLYKFTKGHNLQSELLMNTMMKSDKCGIGYKDNQVKKAKAQHQPQQ